jgi:predicted nuclease with RNAse H fold
MRTLGIDLAAQPRGTAAALIVWDPAGPKLELLRVGLDDDALVELIGDSEKVGIDAPLGWPDEFVEAISAHHERRDWPGRGQDPDAYRFRLSFRETDRQLMETGARRPLSVSTDLIGVVAMRAANLLNRLAGLGRPVDRAGSGVVAEVYPAPALAAWGINAAGYKAKAAANRLPTLLDALEEPLGGLQLDPEQRRLAITDHNCFDAIVCALIARAAALGLTHPPAPGEQADRAVREGWIQMPSNALADLLDRP